LGWEFEVTVMKNLLFTLIFSLVSFFAFAQNNEKEKWHRLSIADSIEIQKTWTLFKNSIVKEDYENLKKLSLKVIECDICLDRNNDKAPPKNYYVSIETFIKQSSRIFKESPFSNAIKTRGYNSAVRTILNYKPRNLPKDYGKDFTIYELYIQTFRPNEWAKNHEGQTHAFQFVKVKGEFKLYGLTSIP
jgi:hypothetical protein